jgi:para-nitrobenzyl esterase
VDAIVETSSGRLRGRAADGVCVFRGVPFAEPPVGTRRFQAPAPLAAWPGTRDALAFGLAPPQPLDPMVEALGLLAPHPQGEDCLYLNVWTPAPDARRRPVLVWIHGGAFLTGTGAAPLYDGARLAVRGDVVVVTLNYRVGALGFGAFQGAQANLGLLDQIAALAWVRREIERFGGDPENVTAFGESAGAGSILALLCAPRATGLLRRAIAQSPGPLGFLSRSEAARRAHALCRRLELREPSARALRDVALGRLLEAQAACVADGPHAGGMFFAPVVDGELLPEAPLAAFRAGRAQPIELVIGTTAEELRLYAMVPGFGDVSDAQLERGLAARLRDPARVLARYREARARRGEDVSARSLFFALESDWNLRFPSILLAESHARRGARAYMYLFAHASPAQGGALGSCHALDLPFTFGNLDSPEMRRFAGEGPAVVALAGSWMDATVAFARSGDPSHPGIGCWPAYDAARRATMRFGEKCHAVDAPLDAERAALAEASGGAPPGEIA